MERLLVIGSSGLIGNRMLQLAGDKYEVFGTYNTHEVKGRGQFKLDVTDRNATFKLIEKLKPDFVIDSHGLNDIDYCELHPEEAWNVNFDGSRNIAEACKKTSCKYVFISVDHVFDGKKLKYTEKDKTHPLNYFAKTKTVMESTLAALDMNYLIARTSTVYGIGGMAKTNFAIWLIEKLRKKEHVKIVTDKKNNPTFVDNLIDVILELNRKDEVGLFHIAGRECLNRFDFSKEITNVFDLDSKLITPVSTPELNRVAPRPESVNLSSDKAERATRINLLSVHEGLKALKSQLSAD